MLTMLTMLFHCFTVSLFHCFTVSLFHCFTVSLFHCFTVSLFHCFTDSLHPSPATTTTTISHHSHHIFRSDLTDQLVKVGDIMLWVRKKMNSQDWFALHQYLHDNHNHDQVRGTVAEDEFIQCRVVSDDYMCQHNLKNACEGGSIAGVVGRLVLESADVVSLDVALAVRVNQEWMNG
jgi:hypothetical protein